MDQENGGELSTLCMGSRYPFATDDFKEGVKSFLEKWPAQFKGS